MVNNHPGLIKFWRNKVQHAIKQAKSFYYGTKIRKLQSTEQSKAVFTNKLLFITRAPVSYIVYYMKYILEPDMTSLLSLRVTNQLNCNCQQLNMIIIIHMFITLRSLCEMF